MRAGTGVVFCGSGSLLFYAGPEHCQTCYSGSPALKEIITILALFYFYYRGNNEHKLTSLAENNLYFNLLSENRLIFSLSSRMLVCKIIRRSDIVCID